MNKLYKRLAARCQSPNQLNKLHITLENRMTPLELAALRGEFITRKGNSWLWKKIIQAFFRIRRNILGKDSVVRKYISINTRELSKVWLAKLHDQYLLAAGNNAPAPFVRKRLGRAVVIYEAGGDRAGKTLVVCFSGNFQRMMMPTPVFLQSIDANNADVVLLRTEKHKGYRTGIQELTSDLQSSLAALKILLKFDEYRRVVTVGTSGGAMPALLSALYWQADACLSVSPNNPEDDRWHSFADGEGAPGLFKHFGMGEKPPPVHIIYGENSIKDAESAGVIESILPSVRLVPVPGAGHVALFPLLERGELGGVLQRALFDAGLPGSD
ncbi:MAG: pimeloyl-ACP methyl ester carboxylesterase [Porticoccus sp.]|uniref:hypothetical protein n=1 Tax=Porticoccus sp. TaxID=2024853 RepID=UPI0039E6F1ED